VSTSIIALSVLLQLPGSNPANTPAKRAKESPKSLKQGAHLDVPACTEIGAPRQEVKKTVMIRNDGTDDVSIRSIDRLDAGKQSAGWYLRTVSDECSKKRLRTNDSCQYTVAAYLDYDGTPGGATTVHSSAGKSRMAFILYEPHHRQSANPGPNCTTK
jgi:hypothetical protein